MARSQLTAVFTILSCLGAAAACSSAASSSTGAAAAGGSTGFSVGTGGRTNNNGGTDPGFHQDTSTGGSVLPQNDAGRPLRCDDQGNCVCLTIAEIGTAGQFGASPGADGDVAFQSWMNNPDNSNAHVDLYKSKPTINADFLAKYDIIVLQALTDNSSGGPYWTFSKAEQDALSEWVNNGGAIISMTGYSAMTQEVDPTNTLLKFSGLSYNTDDVGVDGDCTLYPADTAMYGNQPICWCGTAINVWDWNTSDSDIRAISNHDSSVSKFQVGAYHGRSINAPNDAHVAATLSANGKKINAAVGQIVGKGRVFAWFDEWITYTSQWTGEGLNADNKKNPMCQGALPNQAYQTSQFWYNMIKWSVPDAACFQIKGDDTQPVVVW